MCTPLKMEQNDCITLELPGLPIIEASLQEGTNSIGKWVIFKGCGFNTESDALREGKKFGDALSIAGVTGKLGIDIGHSKSTLSFGKQIHEAIKQKTGRELRAEMHGLMTFQKDTTYIMGFNAQASVSLDKKAFEQRLTPWVTNQNPLTERQRNCAALLNDSFFTPNIEGQFILRISAVEALCDQTDVGAEYQDVILSLKDHLSRLSIESDTRTAIVRLLENAGRQSLRQSYMMKFKKLLSETEAKAFDKLYGQRGMLLHDGLGRGSLSQASAETLGLATSLFEAELLKK
jgi:hypothetical protein